MQCRRPVAEQWRSQSCRVYAPNARVRRDALFGRCIVVHTHARIARAWLPEAANTRLMPALRYICIRACMRRREPSACLYTVPPSPTLSLDDVIGSHIHCFQMKPWPRFPFSCRPMCLRCDVRHSVAPSPHQQFVYSTRECVARGIGLGVVLGRQCPVLKQQAVAACSAANHVPLHRAR